MTTSQLTRCTLCPGDELTASTLTDALGLSRPTCPACALSVWAGDWKGIQANALDYQLHDANRWERIVRGPRARRTAKRWARAVKRLMNGQQINSKEASHG